MQRRKRGGGGGKFATSAESRGQRLEKGNHRGNEGKDGRDKEEAFQVGQKSGGGGSKGVRNPGKNKIDGKEEKSSMAEPGVSIRKKEEDESRDLDIQYVARHP